MSSCLVLQAKDKLYIGADTSSSVFINDKLYRLNNNTKKLYLLNGNTVLYCAGNNSIAEKVVQYIYSIYHRNDFSLMSLKNWLIEMYPYKNKDKTVYDVEILIATFKNNRTVVYQMSQYKNYDIISFEVSDAGVQILSAGIKNAECMSFAENELLNKSDVKSIFRTTFNNLSCNYIGGCLDLYEITKNGAVKIFDNEKINEHGIQYVHDVFNGLSVSLNAEVLVSKLVMSENLWLENNSGNYKFDDNGFTATSGKNTIKIQPNNSGELFSIYKDSNKQFYINSDGDVEYAGTLRGATGIFSGLLKGGSIDIGNNSFTVDTDGIFSLAGGRLKFDGKSLSFAPDVTISWNQITDTDNVADKNDIPTDISQLNDAYGQKWSTTVGENWIKTSTVTAQNLNVQNLDTVNSNGYVKAKTSNQYAALEVACADDGAGIRIYNGTKNGSSWTPILGTYSQISSIGIAFYENYNKVMKLSSRSGLDMNNHSIFNCSSINLISDTIPTSTSRDSNKAPSYTACASMIDNLKALIPSTSNFAPANHSHGNYVSNVSVSSSGSTGTKFVHDASIIGNTLYLTRYVYSASDIRLKQNVTDLPDLTQIYMQLKPKKFKYSDVLKGYSKDWKFGLIAQDMERLFYEANIPIEETGLITLEQSDSVFNEDKLVGDDVVHRINYDQFHAMHIQMIQKHQNEIEELKQEIEELKETIKK